MTRLTEETRRTFPEATWVRIAGLRDRLVHACFDISPDIFWNSVQEDPPELINQVETALLIEPGHPPEAKRQPEKPDQRETMLMAEGVAMAWHNCF